MESNHDDTRDPGEISRRAFIAASGGVLLAGGIPSFAHAEDPAPKLALNGGEKAVGSIPPLPVRWGGPERERLNAVIDQDTLFYWKGPHTTMLAERFQKQTPLKHVMTCGSGTAALHIAIMAAGIAPGDEVITTPITDIGTVIGVIYQQAVPVFADIDPATHNLDPASVEKHITTRTKAIIAVHLAGNPCDMTALKTLADRHGLVLIEDCAQAWGAKFRGAPVGTIGHIACWSLQNSKHVTCGDGGVAASNDERFGPLLQRFGDKGFDRMKPGLWESFAPNYRMTEEQAAIACAQLDRLEGIASTRARLGDLLTARIKDLPGIVPHKVDPADRCSYWFYMLRLKTGGLKCTRDEFVKALAAEGAPVSGGYIPVPLYKNPVFVNHGFFAGRWPVRETGMTRMDYSKVECGESEALLSQGLRVHLHEAMSDSVVESIGEAFRKVTMYYAA